MNDLPTPVAFFQHGSAESAAFYFSFFNVGGRRVFGSQSVCPGFLRN
ncbi:MAG: hypothetical protein M3367_09930 [Acidobacteriota bacterium]|nr:hypothetical protein [Acidobacteriota bacterium]